MNATSSYSYYLIRAVVQRLDVPVLELGRLILVGARTMRRWVALERQGQDVPAPVEILLYLLVQGDVTLEQLREARDRVKRRRQRTGKAIPSETPD